MAVRHGFLTRHDPRNLHLQRTDGPWNSEVVRLCVVHMADDFVVVEKPAGLPSVPGKTEDLFDSIQSRAREVFPDADGPLIVHRLDIETSGLLVLGLNRPAHSQLSRQFQERKTGKSYVAVLDGVVEGDEGAVELPVCIDWDNRPLHHVDFENGKPARTLWRVLERRDDTTRVQFRPITGRSHQLRVHAAASREIGGLGCPILGDSLYGDPTRARRMLLHAETLSFWEPNGGPWRAYESPAPF